jgi:hypothetical protein
VLDSICKTLSNYFGEGTEIYYLVDGNNFTDSTIQTGIDTPYEP